MAGELRTAGSGEGAPDGGETRPRPGLSAAALLGLFPLFVVLGALIKLTRAGPVFFAQRRVGHQGRIFTMLKFRSMVLNAGGVKPRFGTTPPLVDVARARARGHARADRTLEVGLLRGGDARGRPTTLEVKHLIRRRRRLHRCPAASARQGLGGEPGAAPERPGTNGSITARGRAARTARASASARSARTAISGVCSAPADASARPGRLSEDTSTLPPWPESMRRESLNGGQRSYVAMKDPQREVKIAPRRGIPDPFKVLKLSDAPRIAREALLHLAGVAGRGVCGGGLACAGAKKGRGAVGDRRRARNALEPASG